MIRYFLIFIGMVIGTNASSTADKQYIDTYNFLELSKNYMKVHKVHRDVFESKKLINNLEGINFSYKPLKKPIKPLDNLQIHYAYPLKIFLPNNTTVTKVILSNSKEQLTFSQNMVFVSVNRDFLSGLLDIFYIYNGKEKSGKHISIKLDRYIPKLKDIKNSVLYTQIQYYKSKKLNFSDILASLKPFEYKIPFSQVKYMGVIYDIKLVNIVENGKVLKRYMNDKYINCSLEYKGKEFNYYVE